MSYVRWNKGTSDVYVYASVEGGIVCCGCKIQHRIDAARQNQKWRTATRYLCHWIMAWVELGVSLLRLVSLGTLPPFTMFELHLSEWLYRALGANIIHSGQTTVDTPRQMIDHLQQHRDEGDTVPNHPFRRLADEINDFSMFPEEAPEDLARRKMVAITLSKQRKAILEEMEKQNICRDCYLVMPYWSEICHNCED